MTTYDPDTLQQDSAVLKDIMKRFDGELALNCAVKQGGAIELNQNVELSVSASLFDASSFRRKFVF